MTENPNPEQPDENNLGENSSPEPLAPETPAATPPAEEVLDESGQPPEEPPGEQGLVTPQEPTQPAQPSRLGRFFRRLLRWTVLVLGLIAIGILITYLVRVRPLQVERDQAASAHTAALQRADKLQNDLNTARGQVDQLQKTNQDLNTQVEAAKAHIALLQVLSDVNQARYNLALNNPANARVSLNDAQNSLNGLLTYSSSREPNLSTSVKQRLNLVMTELDQDPKTASSDLGILTDQLNELEKKLFG